MTPRIRKLTLTTHVIVSVGWLGAVAAYLALAITAFTSRDAQMVRAAYFAMELIGWFVIVPCSLAALLTGLVQSLATDWGLFRHYWILAKFFLTVGGITILLMHIPVVSRISGVATETRLLDAALAKVPNATFVIHAGGGFAVLLAATTLSVYKPLGLTPYGRRRMSQPVPAQPTPSKKRPGSTRWGLYVLVLAFGLLLLLLILHLAGGGMHH